MNNYSILMSVYFKDKAPWLKEAIESMLNQTVKSDDFVIVCDGPLTPELDEVLEFYNKQYEGLFNILRRDKNYGLGPSLAFAISYCKHELVARMDSDDISLPDRCEKELMEFEKNPNLDIVGCWESEFEEDPLKPIAIHKVPSGSDNIKLMMRRRCSLLHPTVIYKKRSVINCGNYHDVRLFEDYDLFMRMVVEHNCNTENVQKALYNMRVGKEFYKRRGGIKYMKTIVAFKKQQRKKGFMSRRDYFISCWTQRIVCLMPNRMRKWFYLKFLRK